MQTNEQILTRMADDLKLRGLASRTQSEYLRYARIFLNWAGKPAETLGEESIREFLKHLIDGKPLCASTINLNNAALRFLFAVTLNRNLNYRQIPRLKQSSRISEILSKNEIVRLIDNSSSLRNKAILMTIYGAGLRVSELCKLKVQDIDSESMRIFIRCGKRGKDRYTLLSQTNLDVLRKYWKAYRPQHPDGWLFLNSDGSKNIHFRTAQHAFNSAVKSAGISKHVTTHTLRACFATHLLESGVDIFTIMRLLGHSRVQSTMAYLRLVKFSPTLISPLDTLPGKRSRKPKEVIANA